jgi:disulfide oxidoreductase YuzD
VHHIPSTPASTPRLTHHYQAFANNIRRNARHEPFTRQPTVFPLLYTPSQTDLPVNRNPYWEPINIYLRECLENLQALEKLKYPKTSIHLPRSWIIATAREIRAIKSIRIVQADKNMGTCLVDTDRYVEEGSRQLHDPHVYSHVLTLSPSVSIATQTMDI